MNYKKCCFTGRRNIPDEYIENVYQELEKEILCSIKEGYNYFISGFASGADLLAAKAVINLRLQYNILLEAYLPYEKRKQSKTISDLIDKCDNIIVCSPYYFRGCYHKRNRCMVDQCNKLIAVTDGKDGGGTGYTIKYAEKKKIEVVQIIYGI